jgi:ABC-2 type transport system permease protein
MLKQIQAMTWKELKIYLKDPAVWAWMFLQPFILIVVLSFAMGGAFGPDADATEPLYVLAVNQDLGPRAAEILRQLDEMPGITVETSWQSSPLTQETAERLIVEGERSLALVFPASFSENLATLTEVEPAQRVIVVAIVDPNPSDRLPDPRLVSSILETVQGLVERAALKTSLAEQVDVAAMVTVERTVPAGAEIVQPSNAFQYNVPGITIYGIFWIVSLLAGSVFLEKQDGTFRRLLVAPMSRFTMLCGKVLPYYLINLLQIAVLLALSALVFGISLGSSPAGLVAVSLAAAASATGLGVLVAALARTQAQVGAIATILLLTLAMLGGCFIPRWVMPEWLQTIGLLAPHAWAVDAFQALMVQGAGLLEILPEVGVLSAFAVLFFGLGVWRFRFE